MLFCDAGKVVSVIIHDYLLAIYGQNIPLYAPHATSNQNYIVYNILYSWFIIRPVERINSECWRYIYIYSYSHHEIHDAFITC